jgi:hypothetical protein
MNPSSRSHARTALSFAAFTMSALALFVALDGLLRLAIVIVWVAGVGVALVSRKSGRPN